MLSRTILFSFDFIVSLFHLFCSQRRWPWNVGSLITQLTKSFGDKLWFSWQSISIFFGQDRSCYIFLVGVGSALWSVNPPHPIHYWSTAGAQRGDQPAQHSYLHLKFAREVYIVTTTLKLYTLGNPHTPYSKSQMTRQICHLVHRSV